MPHLQICRLQVFILCISLFSQGNQISLAGTHTVELEQRENEQTRQRQLSDKAGREQIDVT